MGDAYAVIRKLQARVQELEAENAGLRTQVAMVEPQRDEAQEWAEYERAQNARLRVALKEYGWHRPLCDKEPCNCGWEQLWLDLAATRPAEDAMSPHIDENDLPDEEILRMWDEGEPTDVRGQVAEEPSDA